MAEGGLAVGRKRAAKFAKHSTNSQSACSPSPSLLLKLGRPSHLKCGVLRTFFPTARALRMHFLALGDGTTFFLLRFLEPLQRHGDEEPVTAVLGADDNALVAVVSTRVVAAAI